MTLILGKITNAELNEVELDENDKQIKFNFELTFNDNTTHKYCYDENKLFFIIPSEDLMEPEEKKYITLCDQIDFCEFSYENNKLTTKITIGEIVYNNIFNIVF